jgi:methylmalonyl-CoA mutase
VAKNENPNQGSFIIDELTDLVEEAVLREFEAIASRGGVLGAMETGYQRSKIQDESLHYEQKKHDGSLPIVGVNMFRGRAADPPPLAGLVRSTEEEKQSQVARVREFQNKHAAEAGPALARLKQAATRNENLFAVLMDTVKYCSLGQISNALFEVGGQYRRNV